MAESSTAPGSTASAPTLEALLASIDQEIATSLVVDVALGKEKAARNIKKRRPFVAFIVAGMEMALPIDAIQEIGYLPEVTPLPNLPGWIRGVIQIRGEILSVVDFTALFSMREDNAYSARKSYILFRQQDLKFCLPVSRIAGVVNIEDTETALKPVFADIKTQLGGLADFVKGLLSSDNRSVCVLDHEKLGTAAQIRKWR
jgi:purine-binding chemotaxis protein CheW